MSSCVPSTEQNERVVSTGKNVILGKFKVFDHIQDNICIVCPGKLGEELAATLKDALYENFPARNCLNVISAYDTFFDIPPTIQQSSKMVVICYSFLAYNEKQSLFHRYAEKCGLTPYDVFNQVCEQTIQSGDGLVFTKGGAYWCPDPRTLKHQVMSFRPAVQILSRSDVSPEPVKPTSGTQMNETTLEPSRSELLFAVGEKLEQIVQKYSIPSTKETSPEPVKPTDPILQQLTALTTAVTALTKLVEEHIVKNTRKPLEL